MIDAIVASWFLLFLHLLFRDEGIGFFCFLRLILLIPTKTLAFEKQCVCEMDAQTRTSHAAHKNYSSILKNLFLIYYVQNVPAGQLLLLAYNNPCRHVVNSSTMPKCVIAKFLANQFFGGVFEEFFAVSGEAAPGW